MLIQNLLFLIFEKHYLNHLDIFLLINFMVSYLNVLHQNLLNILNLLIFDKAKIFLFLLIILISFLLYNYLMIFNDKIP